MRTALLALAPWMAVAAAAEMDTPAAAKVTYTFFSPVFDPPALRLGDECFIPAALTGRIGWTADVKGLKARVAVDGRAVDTFVRRIEGVAHIPLRTVVSALGGHSEWAEADRLRVFSRIKRIAVGANSIEAEGTLRMGCSVSVVDNPKRIVLDVHGARLDPNAPPAVSGAVRFSQFNAETVRAVAQVSGNPQLDNKGIRNGLVVKVRWAGAGSVALRPLSAARGVTPSGLSIGSPVLQKDSARETVLRVPYMGPAPAKLVAQRDREGVFWVHLPGAVRLDGAASQEVSGQVIRSASVVDLEGAGLSVRLDLKRTMEVRASATASDLVIRLALPANASGSLADKVIVVDAGHGGTDTGARYDLNGEEHNEKDLTLAIAKLVSDGLSSAGCTVLMTRDDDEAVGLYDRPEVANASQAHFFVSIHINSNRIANSRSGTFTYYHKGDPHSRLLAECIQAEIAKVSGLPDHGVRSDTTVAPNKGFAVLRMSRMPAVLVEVAYINNETDRKLLATDDFRRRVAEAIVRGIRVYIGDTGKEKEP